MKPQDDSKSRLRARQELDASHIVEAAAGTGKTTLLIDRILNLITDKGARPEEIVAITFTERAAAELKLKLEQELTRRLERERGKQVAALRNCLENLERMQISTIHAFCAKLLRQRAIEAAIDPGFEVADELQASLLARQAWEDFLGRCMDQNDEALRRALELGIGIDAIESLAFTMAANRDILDLLPAELAIDEEIDDFIRKLESIVDRYRDHRSLKRLANQLAMLKDLVGRDREVYIFRKLLVHPTEKVSDPRLNQELDDLIDLYDSLKASIVHNIISRLANTLTGFIDEYQSLKSRQGVLDFHDLLLLSCEMLRRSPDVTSYFRSHYKYVLVDEFQDTDPLQAQIVFYLTARNPQDQTIWHEMPIEPGRLFLVGDPKQSIYRFRRADIEMYAAAKSALPKCNHLTISKNFRCVPSIIEFVNAIFGDLISRPDDGDYQPEYVPLVPGRSTKTCGDSPGVVLLYPTTMGCYASASERRQAETKCIASFIRRMIDEDRWRVWDKHSEQFRPIAYKDIAILLRTHTPLEMLEDALRLYEVEYRVVGGKHFYIRQEVEDLIATLQAIDNPYDSVALVRALKSPFFGLSDEDIFLFDGKINYLQDAKGTPLEKPLNLLRSLHDRRNQLRFTELLDHLLEATGAHITYLLKPNGEQRLANLKKIADIARALLDRGVSTFSGIVTYLSEMQQIEAEEGEAPTVEGGDNFVRILTIHKAKGLEFPMVILCDLASPRRASETFIVDRKRSRLGIRMGSSKSALITRDWRDLATFEKKRSDAEERRLLYVAMTRARDYLVVPCYWMAKSECNKHGAPHEGTFLRYLFPAIPKDPREVDECSWASGALVYPTHLLDVSKQFPPAFRVNLKQKPSKKDTKHLTETAAHWQSRLETIQAQLGYPKPITTATEVLMSEQAQTKPGADSKALVFGQIVHRLLERTIWEKGKVDKEDALRLVDADVGDDLLERAVTTVNRVLSSALVKRITSARYYKEVPFVYRSEDRIFEGKIDVIFIEDGEIRFVDFKTDTVSKRQASKNISKYKPQMEIYAQAIEKACGTLPKEAIIYFTHPLVAVSVPIENE